MIGLIIGTLCHSQLPVIVLDFGDVVSHAVVIDSEPKFRDAVFFRVFRNSTVFADVPVWRMQGVYSTHHQNGTVRSSVALARRTRLGTPAGRSLMCPASDTTQVRQGHFIQNTVARTRGEASGVFGVFLVSPNRQHEQTTGRLEVLGTNFQNTQLAFRRCNLFFKFAFGTPERSGCCAQGCGLDVAGDRPKDTLYMWPVKVFQSLASMKL